MILFLSLFDLQAQEVNKVPSSVLSEFSKKFPDINTEDVDWDQKKEFYRAEFIWNNTEYGVYFDKAGKWVTTITEYKSTNSLPPKVKEAFEKSEFSSYRISVIEIKEKAESTTYKIEVEKGLDISVIYFNQYGIRI